MTGLFFEGRVKEKIAMAHVTNTKAFKVLQVLYKVCGLLTQDEILFWARSDSILPAFFAERRRQGYASKESPGARPCHYLDMDPSSTVLKLVEKLLHEYGGLSVSQQQYVVSHTHVILTWLAKGEIEFVGEQVSEQVQIPRLEKAEARMSLKRESPFNEQYVGDVAKRLMPVYGATPEACAAAYPLRCALAGREVIRHIGGEDAFAFSTFTPQQIRHVALQQKTRGSLGPLAFDQPNYFPIKANDGTIDFLSLWWVGPSETYSDKPSRNRWRFCLKGEGHMKTDSIFMVLG